MRDLEPRGNEVSDLEQHMDKVRQHLTEKYAARERALQSSREAIRHSANSIRAVHRGELGKFFGSTREKTSALWLKRRRADTE